MYVINQINQTNQTNQTQISVQNNINANSKQTTKTAKKTSAVVKTSLVQKARVSAVQESPKKVVKPVPAPETLKKTTTTKKTTTKKTTVKRTTTETKTFFNFFEIPVSAKIVAPSKTVNKVPSHSSQPVVSRPVRKPVSQTTGSKGPWFQHRPGEYQTESSYYSYLYGPLFFSEFTLPALRTTSVPAQDVTVEQPEEPTGK